MIDYIIDCFLPLHKFITFFFQLLTITKIVIFFYFFKLDPKIFVSPSRRWGSYYKNELGNSQFNI